MLSGVGSGEETRVKSVQEADAVFMTADCMTGPY